MCNIHVGKRNLETHVTSLLNYAIIVRSLGRKSVGDLSIIKLLVVI